MKNFLSETKLFYPIKENRAPPARPLFQKEKKKAEGGGQFVKHKSAQSHTFRNKESVGEMQRREESGFRGHSLFFPPLPPSSSRTKQNAAAAAAALLLLLLSRLWQLLVLLRLLRRIRRRKDKVILSFPPLFLSLFLFDFFILFFCFSQRKKKKAISLISLVFSV